VFVRKFQDQKTSGNVQDQNESTEVKAVSSDTTFDVSMSGDNDDDGSSGATASPVTDDAVDSPTVDMLGLSVAGELKFIIIRCFPKASKYVLIIKICLK
jgi:hypothetical protein